jgi:hypothetical protein
MWSGARFLGKKNQTRFLETEYGAGGKKIKEDFRGLGIW